VRGALAGTLIRTLVLAALSWRSAGLAALPLALLLV
jgi:hypothetical protein